MTSKTVAALLAEARSSAGLTQQRLADAARTSQPAVAAYEAGRRTPTISTLDRLLAACGHVLVVDALPVTTRPAVRRSALAALRRRRSALLSAASESGVTNLRVFGSVARRDATEESDVDLLVDLEPGRTLVDLATFRADASALLGKRVDVATLDLLKEPIRKEALREAVPL